MGLFLFLIMKEGEKMIFRSKEHMQIFKRNLDFYGKCNENLSNDFLATIYLLTADIKLWLMTDKFVKTENINFSNVRLKGISVNGYTLFRVAQDIYTGTNYLPISDLANKKIVSPQIFDIIQTAMLIRRNGMKVISKDESEVYQEKT